MVTAALSVVLLLGLYLDGWNHLNIQANELGAFITPWHGLLYLGYALSASWVLSRALTRLSDRRARPSLRAAWEAAPAGYRAGLVGIAMASVAVPGDALWHTFFGLEEGVARVIGPFHLVLFTAIGLLVSSPLRSAWAQRGAYPERSSLRRLMPAVISLAMAAATAEFLIQFSSSFVLWQPSVSLLEPLPREVAASPELLETVHRAAVDQLLLTTAVLMSPLLIASGRWRLPFGSATIVFCSVGLLSAGLNEFALEPVLVATLAAGLAADLLSRALDQRPRVLRAALVGGVVPLVLWTAFFTSLAWIEHVSWPLDLWVGATLMAAALSVLLSLVLVQITHTIVRGQRTPAAQA